MERVEEQFPQYYRKDGKCVKVIAEADGTITGRSIELQPQVRVPLRSFIPQERIRDEIKDLYVCGDEIWKNFLFTFYQQVQHEREGIVV